MADVLSSVAFYRYFEYFQVTSDGVSRETDYFPVWERVCNSRLCLLFSITE